MDHLHNGPRCTSMGYPGAIYLSVAPEPSGDSKNRVEGLMCLMADGNIVFPERGICADSSRGGWRVVVEAAEVEVEVAESK